MTDPEHRVTAAENLESLLSSQIARGQLNADQKKIFLANFLKGVERSFKNGEISPKEKVAFEKKAQAELEKLGSS